MEQFQLLDEHVSNLILRFGFLDVEDLPFATAEEVENAAALALQMAAPEELIEIAVRQSAHRHPHPNPPRAAAAVPARPVPRRPPPLTEPEPEDPNPGAYIDWQERNRILADSPVEPDDGAEEGGEDCIICSGGREPKLQLPCGCWFCAPCLRGCIRAGLRQGGWPPKCCEPLQNDAIRSEPPNLLELQRQVIAEQPPLPPALQARVVPRPMPQVLPFVPVVEDDFEGHPANFDPDFGGALPLIDVGDGPEPDHIDPEPIMANANGQARGQQRYYIMMFYADGNNTEVGDPNWRRDSPENMRRIREGDETEGRNRGVGLVFGGCQAPAASKGSEGSQGRQDSEGSKGSEAQERVLGKIFWRLGRRVRDRPLNSQGTTLHDSVPVM
ncbi:hypothetical protein CFRS1_v001030 [Colletotrichum fructicola]|nr:hypothetical protein CFRS1_v001030 [Colletotrichum fructicola]